MRATVALRSCRFAFAVRSTEGRVRSRRAAVCAVALALAGAACTGRPRAEPAGTPTPPASPPASPAPTHPATPGSTLTPAPRPAAFDAKRVLADVRRLAIGIGTREAAGAGYRRAAGYLAAVFEGLGYEVRRQRVPVPSGVTEGVAVPAGTTENVIAVPPGFDPTSPHLVVGAHLDTVPVSPGANDNASGSAVLLELARLATLEAPAMAVVWVAFGGEERRRAGPTGRAFGSRWYLDHLPGAERRALRGMLSIDMVGNGPEVLVCHGGRTPRGFVDALLASAKRLDVPARERVITSFFSDHTSFERQGFTVAWLWAGGHSTVHTARDTIGVVRLDELARVGTVAWETLRRLRL